jgi:ribosomal protein S27AE
LIASRRRERLEKAAGFCPQCGKPVQISDKFCPRCGASLLVEEGQKA